MTNVPKAQPVVGLEIGTSKICVVVGEQADGGFNLLGLGQSKSRGVRKGEIIDTAKVEEDLRAAIFEAEQMANVKIRSVFLGITGSHVYGFNRHVEMVFAASHEISSDDIEQLVNGPPAFDVPDGRQIIHRMQQLFVVDGKKGVVNPAGMIGSRIEVDSHLVCGQASRLQKAVHLVNTMNLEVDGLVFNGIASEMVLLTREQKELGALVVDMGGGATEFVVYAEGELKHSGVLAVGGDHVTNDLANGLKIPLSLAEKLKIKLGAALVTDEARSQQFPITDDRDSVIKNISIGFLQNIMSLRLEEIFGFIAHQLEKARLMDCLRGGVYLCGGLARTPGILHLAETGLRMKTALGQIGLVGGLTTANQPEFATAIGLAQYGLAAKRQFAEPMPPPSPLILRPSLPEPKGSPGRFSNTEPTRCNGEDWDVPTFVRQGHQEPNPN